LFPAVREQNLVVDDSALRETGHRGAECSGIAIALKPDDIGAEQAFDDLSTPRKLGKEPLWRKRDVHEERDREVRAQLTKNRRNQLQLIVVHPHDRVELGNLSNALGEAPVDHLIALPPLAMVLRWGNDVVVEGPDSSVREPLVVKLEVAAAQRYRRKAHVAVLEWLKLLVDGARPTDPGATELLDDGLHRGHKT